MHRKQKRECTKITVVQLLHEIVDGFNAAINAARIAKLPHEELQKLFEFALEENQYE